MRHPRGHVAGVLLLFCVGLLNAAEAPREAGGKVDEGVRRLIGDVDAERMSKHLFYLARDPLPYRKLNLTLPGHEKNTLHEADDYLAGKLEAWGYRVEREGVQVQAFRRDTSKPKHAQYSPPKPEDPWYTAYNLYAEKKGRSRPDKIIVVLAHKDSQSWIDSPGANDNAIGTAGGFAANGARRGCESGANWWSVRSLVALWTCASQTAACPDRSLSTCRSCPGPIKRRLLLVAAGLPANA